MEDLEKRYIFNSVFPSIVLSFYNYFLLKAMWALIGSPNNNIIILISLGVCVLTLISSYIELYNSNKFTRSIMVVLESWKWPSLIFLFIMIILYLISYFVIIPKIITISIYLVVFLIGFYAYYNAHKIKVIEYELEIENLKEELNIIHISDIHYGTYRNQGLLKKIVEKINYLADKGAQLVIISGDLADGSTSIGKEDFNEFKNIKIPVIFTPGNHDYYPGIEKVYSACENAGIYILNNNYCTFKDLSIYGLNYSFTNPQKSFNQFNINPETNNIMVYHAPDHWKDFIKYGFDIQLSGHTHGGQFYPANLWVGKFFPFCKGLFINNQGDKTSYLSVSTGVGTMGPPLRLGTNSEMVLLKLIPKKIKP